MRPKRHSISLVGFSIFLSAATSVCWATTITPITYQVEQGPIGIVGGTVTGTITTDGTTGPLATGDILSWNLVLANGTMGDSSDLMSGTISLSGTATTATATQLQFNYGSGPPWGTLGSLEILDATSGWGWNLAGEFEQVFSPTDPAANFDSGLKALSPQPVTLGTLLTLLPLQGGTSSSPVLVANAGVSGTIGGLGSEDYYFFSWVGGPFSATTSVIGASASGSYAFSLGAVGSCNSVSSVNLDNTDGFSSTIFLPNLARGQYCIGLDADSASDPNFSLIFNTPISSTPEPSGLILMPAALAAILFRRRWVRS